MAVNDRTSGQGQPEWSQLYQQSLGHPTALPAMFTTMSSPSPSPAVAGPSAISAAFHPGIEGRVGKSTRRRSKASRRAPTTLLNTSTTNFRAMVQQFTGIPSTGGPTINFGFGFNEQQLQQPTLVQQQQHQQYQRQQFQRQQEGSLFALDNNSNRDVFLQGFSSNQRAPMEMPEGFFMDGLSGQPMPRPPTTNISLGGYLY